MIADTIILGVIAVELAVILWIGRESDAPEPRSGKAAVPPPAEPVDFLDRPDVLPCTENDLRIESLIQQVDPSWKLGDDRSHVTLVPNGDGKIVEARLR